MPAGSSCGSPRRTCGTCSAAAQPWPHRAWTRPASPAASTSRQGSGLRWTPTAFRQAVDNLLANAARFAPAGSVIVVTAREDGPDLRVEVSDDGPGFPDAFLPHAFERFRRPDGGRSRDDGGAGLGLAIVQAICAAHGGQATARNKPGGGAVVSLRFPGAIR